MSIQARREAEANRGFLGDCFFFEVVFLRKYKSVGVCDGKSVLIKDGGKEPVGVARRLLMKEHARGDYDVHALECLAKRH